MEIQMISENKRDFLPLLLLGDEQEEMIDRYLDWGELFALYNGDTLRSVVAAAGEGGMQLKDRLLGRRQAL